MRAFISYSHRDTPAVDRFHTHLASLRREGLIETWFDRSILPGDQIDTEIETELETCNLFLMLISPDFLESDYCVNREMRRALERHDAGEARVVPIILEPCDWASSSLRQLKAVPRDGKPISEWTNENSAYLDIINELRRILEADQGVRAVPLQSAPFGSTVGPDPVARRYRVQRDFDEIDRGDYRDRAFATIRDYFQKSIAEIDSIEDLRGRFTSITGKSFGCTVVNNALNRGRGSAHITVSCGRDSFGLGDIHYAFGEDVGAEHANGMFNVDADEYDLYLSSIMSLSFSGEHERLTPEEAAKRVWSEFLQQAGISYA